MWTLQEEFSHIDIGRSSQFRNLTLFPLLRRSVPLQELDYLLLEDGIAQGKVRVTELNSSGSVPELRIENTADLPVLLVDGEELVGAKQNRVLNLTILAPAKQTTIIPVSCVEAGRWNMASPDLKPVDHFMYSGIRSERLSQVTESMRSNGSHASDQGAVWRNIAAKALRLKASSPTGAMSAIYERHANSVEEFSRAFTCEEGQCGVAFAIGGRLLGLDIFDHPEVMRRFFQKLVRSYALDALDVASGANETPIGAGLGARERGSVQWARDFWCGSLGPGALHAHLCFCERREEFGSFQFLDPHKSAESSSRVLSGVKANKGNTTNVEQPRLAGCIGRFCN